MFSIPVCCVVAALYGPRVIDFVLSDISGSIPVEFCVLGACSVSTTIGLYLLLLLAKLTNSPLWGSIHGMNQSNVFYSVHFDVKTIYFYFSLADPGVDEVEGRMVEERIEVEGRITRPVGGILQHCVVVGIKLVNGNTGDNVFVLPSWLLLLRVRFREQCIQGITVH